MTTQDTKAARRLQNEAYLQTPQVRAFLDAIKASEGADYGTIVFDAPGTQSITDFSKHPNIKRVRKINGKRTMSSAAGGYQMLGTTYAGLAARTGLSDFSPKSQDINAVELLRETGALDALLAGDMPKAIRKAGTQWASLPASSLGKAHNQNQRSSDYFQSAYAKSLQDVGIPRETAITVATSTKPAPALNKALMAEFSAPLPAALPAVASFAPSMSNEQITNAVADLLKANTTSKLDMPSVDSAIAQLMPPEPPPKPVQILEDPLAALRPEQISDAADAARSAAQAAVFGDTPTLRIPLPDTIETAMTRILQESSRGEV